MANIRPIKNLPKTGAKKGYTKPKGKAYKSPIDSPNEGADAETPSIPPPQKGSYY